MTVEFNEPKYGAGAIVPGTGAKQSFISKTVIKLGLAKDQKGVELVLLVIAVACIVLAAIIVVPMILPAPAPSVEPLP